MRNLKSIKNQIKIMEVKNVIIKINNLTNEFNSRQDIVKTIERTRGWENKATKNIQITEERAKMDGKYILKGLKDCQI